MKGKQWRENVLNGKKQDQATITASITSYTSSF